MRGRGWVDALVHEDVSVPVAGRLRLAAGFVEWATDELEARRQWERAIDIFRGLGDDRYLSYALGLSRTYLGHPGLRGRRAGAVR